MGRFLFGGYPSFMRVYIDHEFRFVPPAGLEQELKSRVTWSNPDRATVARSGRNYHHIPPDWCALERPKGSVEARLPRGLLPQLQDAAKAANVNLEWVPQVRWDPKAQQVPLSDLAITLRDYQQEAVTACVRQRQGVVHLPCGGGKTCVGSALAIHLGQRAVVVVPSIDICDQWVEMLRRLRPSVRIRAIHGESRWTDAPLAPGEIAVGVDASLATDRAKAILDSAGLLITDETHRVASATWRTIVSRCAARWRIGLTATPERADGWDLLLTCLLGPVIFERDQRWLVEHGYLAQPTIFGISTQVGSKASDFRVTATCSKCGKESEVEDGPELRAGLVKCQKIVTIARRRSTCGNPFPAHAEIKKVFSAVKAGSRVAGDPERLEIVRRICAWSMPRDRDVLVLVPRVTVVPKLVKLLLADGVPATGLTGKESKKIRAQTLSAIHRREYRVLIATKLADEGLDLPRMDTLVNTSAGVAAGNAAQRVGRVCRPSGNPPLVFDFVDGGDQYARQWRARSTAYRKAYGDVAMPERKPVAIQEALVRCDVRGEAVEMFGQ